MHPHESLFTNLHPPGFWKHFAAILQIPRPSQREQLMANYIIAWAKQHGFTAQQQHLTGNLLIQVPATPGKESADRTILQGHLDMVCEKQPSSRYDAETGNILIKRNDDWLIAPETTLGADNGVAIAAMLWLAETPTHPHGPLDLLFTVEEETGQQGAARLDPALLRAARLINLDAEDDATICIGCAGGIDTQFSCTLETQPPPADWTATTLKVSGLRGGHSGLDIHHPHLNAIKTLAQILLAADQPLKAWTIRGGSRRNAIPRDAYAALFHPSEHAARIRATFAQQELLLAKQFRGIEDGFTVSIEPNPVLELDGLKSKFKIFSADATRRLFEFLATLPHGVQAMSPDFPNLVETSTNLAVIGTKYLDPTHARIDITSLTRSSNPTAQRTLLDHLQSLARQFQITAAETDGYPGWTPNPNSPLLAHARRIYQQTFHQPPIITAVHAGMECGLLAQKKPQLDMISIGPTIHGPHAPGEKLSIPSVEKFCHYLAALVETL